MITSLQLSEWTDNPVTMRFFRLLGDIRELQVQHITNGATLGNHTEVNTARAVGFINALDKAREIVSGLVEKEEEKKNEHI